QGCGLPLFFIDFYFNGLDRRAIIQNYAEHFMARAVLCDARNVRLQLHVRDGDLVPLHFFVDHLASYGAVPSRLIFSEVLFFLNVNLRQPLHIGDTVPARHDQSQWKALMFRQWFAVERPSQEWVVRHGFFTIQTASELLIEFVLLRAE